uniref:hypothetical protein n=1 Tax=Planococcus lenghuensis TaxID=2213202 RepID=UPI0038CD760D
MLRLQVKAGQIAIFLLIIGYKVNDAVICEDRIIHDMHLFRIRCQAVHLILRFYEARPVCIGEGSLIDERFFILRHSCEIRR